MVSSFSLAARGVELWLDPSSVNAAIVNTYKSACDRHLENLGSKNDSMTKIYDGSNGQSWGPSGVYKASPISLAKALKNPAELQGMRDSHLRYLLPFLEHDFMRIIMLHFHVLVCSRI